MNKKTTIAVICLFIIAVGAVLSLIIIDKNKSREFALEFVDHFEKQDWQFLQKNYKKALGKAPRTPLGDKNEIFEIAIANTSILEYFTKTCAENKMDSEVLYRRFDFQNNLKHVRGALGIAFDLCKKENTSKKNIFEATELFLKITGLKIEEFDKEFGSSSLPPLKILDDKYSSNDVSDNLQNIQRYKNYFGSTHLIEQVQSAYEVLANNSCYLSGPSYFQDEIKRINERLDAQKAKGEHFILSAVIVAKGDSFNIQGKAFESYEIALYSGQHAILGTYKTHFESKGRFTLPVAVSDRLIDMPLKNGFTEKWVLYMEDQEWFPEMEKLQKEHGEAIKELAKCKTTYSQRNAILFKTEKIRKYLQKQLELGLRGDAVGDQLASKISVVDKNESKVITNKRNCEDGDAVSCMVYADYELVNDPKMAEQYFRKSCELGNSKACSYSAFFEMKKPDKKFKRQFETACSAGDNLACIQVAVIFAEVEKDKNSASKLLHKSCEAKEGMACAMYGMFLMELKRERDALEQFKMGCDLNFLNACVYAGIIKKRNGEDASAVEFFKTSCADGLGSNNGCFSAGEMLRKSGERELAKVFYTYACENKLKEACRNLKK